MPQANSSVGAADRVTLLRHGIVVLETDSTASPLGVSVTGHDAARVRELVARRLGGNVEIDVLGDLPRCLEPRPCTGYMEREPRRLQLRLVLGGDEHVDDIAVAEDDRTVVVFATVCASVSGETDDHCDVPCHVYLERPLAGREVIDGTRGTALPYKNVYAALG